MPMADVITVLRARLEGLLLAVLEQSTQLL